MTAQLRAVKVGKSARIPVGEFLSWAMLESLPADLSGRLFLTVGEAAQLMRLDPRTLRSALNFQPDAPPDTPPLRLAESA